MNFLLGCVGVVQVSRILMYRQALKNGTITELKDDEVKDMKDTAKDVAEEARGKAKAALK